MALQYVCNAGHEHTDRNAAVACNDRPALTHHHYDYDRTSCGRSGNLFFTLQPGSVTCLACRRTRRFRAVTTERRQP